MKYEYLLFDILIIFFSTMSAFLYPRSVWPKLKPGIISIFTVGFIYIVWDTVVTGWWWYFNPVYTLGINLGKLPLEEVIFFLAVPWGCLIIWENINSRIKGKVSVNLYGTLTLVTLMLGITSVVFGKWYPALTCLIVLLIAFYNKVNDSWMLKKSSLIFLATVTVLTLIFNGYLTARPVVTYNPEIMSQLKIYTVPIEDVIYGLTLMSVIVMFYEKLKLKF